MAKKGVVRNTLSSFVDVKSWLGYKHVKSGASLLKGLGSTILNTHEKDQYQEEEFKEALARLELKESDVKQIQQGYFRNFVIFFVIGVLLALYSIYRFLYAQWMSGFISLILTVLIFVFSIFAHYWYFQIKNRKLGCSLQEWYQNKIIT